MRSSYRGRNNSSNSAAKSRGRGFQISAERSLELLSTPSRADRLPRAGEESLLDAKTQEAYRALIQSKIDAFLTKYPNEPEANSNRSMECKEMASNILILFRKLREGIVASSRLDAFAIEVYETSAHWSIIFKDAAQSTSILSQLPALWRRATESGFMTFPPKDDDGPMSSHQATQLLHHVHLLRTHHPSQADFQATFKATSDMMNAASTSFLSHLARALRRNNFIALNQLTDPQLNPLLRTLDYKDLHAKALLIALEYLKESVREGIWRCLHLAYRDVSAKPEVQAWLARCLCLGSGISLDEWMDTRVEAGDAAPKPNGDGWSFVRRLAAK